MEPFAGLFISNYLYQIPVFIVWIAGLGIAIARWQRHPRTSMLLTVALIIFLARGIIAPALSFALVHSEIGLMRSGLVQGVVALISALAAAVGWTLVLMAALGARDELEEGR